MSAAWRGEMIPPSPDVTAASNVTVTQCCSMSRHAVGMDRTVPHCMKRSSRSHTASSSRLPSAAHASSGTWRESGRSAASGEGSRSGGSSAPPASAPGRHTPQTWASASASRHTAVQSAQTWQPKADRSTPCSSARVWWSWKCASPSSGHRHVCWHRPPGARSSRSGQRKERPSGGRGATCAGGGGGGGGGGSKSSEPSEVGETRWRAAGVGEKSGRAASVGRKPARQWAPRPPGPVWHTGQDRRA